MCCRIYKVFDNLNIKIDNIYFLGIRTSAAAEGMRVRCKRLKSWRYLTTAEWHVWVLWRTD